MSIIEELWYLIDHLGTENKGYTVEAFCDEYFRIYYSDEAVDIRSDLKNTELERLAIMVSRYSQYQEDLKKYPGVYFSDSDIEAEVMKIKKEKETKYLN